MEEEQVNDAAMKVSEILQEREITLWQSSHMRWLKKGDNNTHSFNISTSCQRFLGAAENKLDDVKHTHDDQHRFFMWETLLNMEE